MFEKNASTRYPINEVLRKRWSGRAYDPQRRLSSQQIMTMLEAARWAPSCFGDEPWRYIICNRDTNRAAWQMALDTLVASNQDWAQSAPVLILAFANSIMSRNGKPNRWGQYDTGAASMSLSLQATAMGLMAHQMGGFDADKVRTLFNIPDAFMPMAVLTVGYQLPVDRIPEQMKERETAARVRRPLEQTFFDGNWGTPITE